MNKIYLASQSPRRAQILQDLGVQFELLLPRKQEDAESLETPLANEAALDYVSRVTLAKLEAAVRRLSQQANLAWAPILCADTTVCLSPADHDVSGSDLLLGKPSDAADAFEMLSLLNGKYHWVHTAVAIQSEEKNAPMLKISSTKVTFANNTSERLRAYVATSEPLGKAGAYGIQGLGSALIARIEGSYSGVMGLPIYETTQLLDYAKIPFILSL